MDLNNSDFVIASKSFNLIVNDEAQTLNTINEIENIKLKSNVENKVETKQITSGGEGKKIAENNISTSNEIVYKPTTLPKAGSTIYFLILPIGGILILIYCIFKKKDENF